MACKVQPDPPAARPGATDIAQPSSTGTAAKSDPAQIPAPGAVETLAGEWRVAGIDGAPLDEAYGIALSANESEMWWEPRCAQRTRRYNIEGKSISFRPIPGAQGETPPCLPGLPARLSDVERALDTATEIGRTPSNGVLISGAGHSVLLFSQ
ncbi:hypothetical protein [Tsuneonella deserti]|uniref:hypothetical protein n=1 Tax=Tsuneonella deserti TaxID=2035528 RepID=UPI00166E9FBF|nr:hypothetical protein [Tsuneonella deserti]